MRRIYWGRNHVSAAAAKPQAQRHCGQDSNRQPAQRIIAFYLVGHAQSLGLCARLGFLSQSTNDSAEKPPENIARVEDGRRRSSIERLFGCESRLSGALWPSLAPARMTPRSATGWTRSPHFHLHFTPTRPVGSASSSDGLSHSPKND